MKKLIFLFAGILLLTGCRENYNAEKAFWKAQRKLKAITKTEAKAQGPAVYDAVISDFEGIAERYPSSPKASESLFVLSNLKIRQKKYADAIELLKKIITNHSEQQAAEARYGIAALYEQTNQWDKAEAMYWETAEYHPLHKKGLYAPIHLIIHEKKAKNDAGAQKTFDRSVDFYKRMLKQAGPIEASTAIKNYLALAYLAYGQWEEARKVWLSIPTEFPKSPFAPIAYLSAAELSWKKGDADSAIQHIEKYLADYPKHELVQKNKVQLALLYQKKKQYAKTYQLLDEAFQAASKNRDTAANIKLLSARALQEEGKWDEAKKTFDEVQTNYAGTRSALEAPLIVAEHLKATGDAPGANKVYEDAIVVYQKVLDSGDAKQASYVENLQNAAFAELGEWDKVLMNFDRRIQMETSAEKKGTLMFLKSVLIEKRINDPKQALTSYESFLKQYPDHPQAKMAKARHDVLLQTV